MRSNEKHHSAVSEFLASGVRRTPVNLSRSFDPTESGWSLVIFQEIARKSAGRFHVETEDGVIYLVLGRERVTA